MVLEMGAMVANVRDDLADSDDAPTLRRWCVAIGVLLVKLRND